jgi:magnesium transporter
VFGMIFRKRTNKPGTRPGTLRIQEGWPQPKIRVFRYAREKLEEWEAAAADSFDGLMDDSSIVWVDVQGLGDEAFLRRMADLFHLHPLAVEDVVNVPQRPKTEAYGNCIFVVTRMIMVQDGEPIRNEQVSIFLGRNFVLTFQERPGDCFDPVRERLRNPAGRMRTNGPDYLAYALLDSVIDGYYPVLEQLGDELAALEKESLEQPTKNTLRATNKVRMTLLLMRRVLWPQREAINSLIRDENALVSDNVRLYLRDTHDHCSQVADVVESYRELVSAVANTYLTVVSNRTNEVMKVLTIMASIFIPLTFMAGIYGMNFDYMPELHMRYGYPLLWAAMIAVGLGMVYYFRRKGWLSGEEDEDEE